MCDHEYEYEPHGIFGTGSASPLSHVEGDAPQPAGLWAAFQRATPTGRREYPVWVPSKKSLK